MLCKNCSTEIPNGFKFCSACGASLKYESSNNITISERPLEYVGKNTS